VVTASSSKSKHKAQKKPNIVRGVVTKDADSSTNTGSDNKNKMKESGSCRLCGDGSRHWARDPECKFKKTPQPKSNGSKSGGRSDESEVQMVHFAYVEPSGVVLTTVDKVKGLNISTSMIFYWIISARQVYFITVTYYPTYIISQSSTVLWTRLN
jgi:hypothetical protein